MQLPFRAVVATTAILAGAHLAEARLVLDEPMPRRADEFKMLDVPIAGIHASNTTPQPGHLRGSSLAALPKGDVLLLDDDSGALVRVSGQTATARLAIGREAPQLVHDAISARAYVVDRLRDRVVVVDTRSGLRRVTSFATPAEPYGIALTPDRKTLLITTVADRTLVALDAATGQPRWRTSLGPEPRGVAISPDGRRAIVTHLGSSAATWLELDANQFPKLSYPSLNRTDPAAAQRNRHRMPQTDIPQRAQKAGKSFARASFAGTFVGNRVAVVAHQTSTPHRATEGRENRSTYGGGGRFEAPVAHHITFVGERASERVRSFRTAQAVVGLHQPRALRYDSVRDTLYIIGYGSDNIIALGDASKPTIHMAWKAMLPGGGDGCGPSGLDVDAAGKVLVHCSFARTMVTVDAVGAPVTQRQRPIRSFRGKRAIRRPSPQSLIQARVTSTKPLTQSRLSDAKRRGRRMFHRGGDAAMSANGSLACSSCHPEGRNDGLSWRIQGMSLQTPLLGGRLQGTHPFKWDGGDANLDTSLRSTVTRLGGRGITKAQAADLAAFLTAIPRPRPPTVKNKRAVAYGAKLFTSEQVGCAKCHAGAKLTDRKKYDLHKDMPKGVDTPSLIGLAASAPYYHDGSATTLRSLLLENGSVHGMGRIRKLTRHQVDALVAYLRTL